MKKSHNIGACPNSRETLGGFFYLAIQFLLLPGMLTWFNSQLSHPLTSAELNFVFYLVNFMAMLLIFHDFLGNSATQIFRHPIYVAEGIVLGFVGYYVMNWLVGWVMQQFFPGFSNYNDEAIAAMSRGNYFLMFVGTVILVPPFEECIYRGLLFRNLYGKSKWAAYTVSTVIFALIHIVGYLGDYSAWELLIAVAQYLPAGLCLGWAYARSETVFAPIVIHAAINFIGISRMR